MSIDEELQEIIEAETKISYIISDLAEKIGKRIDYVKVDTRSFMNYPVEIATIAPAKSAG